MEEEFLYYLWTYRLYDHNITTDKGEIIEVIHPGERNNGSGPDFTNSRIKIGNTLWAGNVEIHNKASDWFKHGHDKDGAYKNVILHVVFEKDIEGNFIFPSIELKNHFSNSLYKNYRSFIESRSWIPCSGQLHDINLLYLTNFTERIAIERLENKNMRIIFKLENNRYNWEQTFFETLARSLGTGVNSDAFEMLAHSVPQTIFAREKKQLINIEALLFGQAGMLNNEAKDTYHKILITEYKYLRKKYNLQPLDESIWNYYGLRPVSFPPVRIAQLAQLIFSSSGLFSKIVNSESIGELKALFRIKTSGYWNEHYKFGHKSSRLPGKFSDDTINLIIINSVIPLHFLYGKHIGNFEISERTLKIMERLPPEENSIIKRWRSCGIAAGNALQSQALLEISKEYCKKRRCLECGIGLELLKTKGS